VPDALAAVDRRAIRREILLLAWPVVLQALLRTVMFLVDTYMLGLYSKHALAAIALVGPVAHTLTMVLAALGTGTLATIARATGAKDRPLQEQEAATSVTLGAGAGLALGAACAPLFPHFGLLFSSATPALAGACSDFLGWMALAIPFTLMSSCASAVLRATGDTRTPLYVGIVANVINVAGNWILIFGKFGAPEMGVAGAGLSTAIALAVEGLLLTAVLFRPRAAIRLGAASFRRVTGGSMRRLLRVSLPAAVEPLLLQVGFLIFIQMMGRLGENALAAHRVAVAVESISFMPGWGLSIACGAIVGQYLGAKRADKAAATLRESVRLALGFTGVFAVILVLFAEPMTRLFVQDPEVVRASVGCLRVASLEQILLSTALVIGGALRGAGDTRSPVVVGLIGVWGVRLPLSYVFAFTLGLGIVGAWTVMLIDWAARTATFVLFWRRGRWKTLEL